MKSATTLRVSGRGGVMPTPDCCRRPPQFTGTASPYKGLKTFAPRIKLLTSTHSISGLSLLTPLPPKSKPDTHFSPLKKIVCFRRSGKRRKRENDAKMKIVVAEMREKRAAEAAEKRRLELERRMAPPKPRKPPVERKLSELAQVAVDHILATTEGGGSAAQACRLFEETLNPFGWEGVIKELAAQSRLDLALDVFWWMETYPPLAPNDRLRSIVINLAGRAGRLDLGFELLETGGGIPGVECFVALAKTCARGGGIEQVMAIFEKMGEAGLQPKVEAYGAVFEEMVVARAPLLHCLRLFSYMQQQNVAPKRVTYTMLVTACHSGGSIKDAYAIFEGLEAARWDPDIKAFNALLYICIVYRDYKEARRVFWRMRETRKIKFNAKSYELVIRLCTEAGWGLRDLLGPGYWDDAPYLYREMRTGQRWPTMAIYEELFGMLGTCNNYAIAGQYYVDMRERAGLEPSPAVYDALVNMDYQGNSQNPVRIINALRYWEYTPDLAFFQGMLEGYARAGAWQEAWMLLTVMPANGCDPPPEMYEVLDGMLTEAGCELAEQVRGKMEEMKAEQERRGDEEGGEFGGESELSRAGGELEGTDGGVEKEPGSPLDTVGGSEDHPGVRSTFEEETVGQEETLSEGSGHGSKGSSASSERASVSEADELRPGLTGSVVSVPPGEAVERQSVAAGS